MITFILGIWVACIGHPWLGLAIIIFCKDDD